ncbi:PIN domain-containing protein [Streptomyces sp. NPDC059396]|uniref:PIN domain-containing protein n=1 Tax=Streptomyces sp. NPDC059396 TaxID=3346819 RepID=UPI0036A3186F
MIILDTNILEKAKLGTTSTDLLKTIGTSGVDVVAVPSVVMEELIAHRIVPERRKYERAAQALSSIAESTPWPFSPKPPAFNHERFRNHWYDQYAEIVTVIPTSRAALQEAFHRETHVLAPCKEVEAGGKTEKVGGRDAAIWLTAVEYAREHTDEKVYFVSGNTRDFGDGRSYAYPMDEDLTGLDGRFIHLISLTEVVNEFATPEGVDNIAAEAALRTTEALRAVAQESFRTYGHRRPGHEPPPFAVAASRTGEFDLNGLGADDVEAVHVNGWLSAPSVKYSSVRDIKAHRIGDHVWCAATAQWLLAGLVLDGPVDAVVVAAGAVWETRVLFSTTQPETPLTVLRTFQPRAATTEELANMPEPPQKPDLNLFAEARRWSRLARAAAHANSNLSGAAFANLLQQTDEFSNERGYFRSAEAERIQTLILGHESPTEPPADD